MRRGLIVLAVLGGVALASCGGSPAPSSIDPSMAADEDSGDTTGPDSTDIANTSCGSLEPLLAMLPAAHSVGGLPEAYRHCDPAAYSVAVGYGQAGPQFSGYEFTIKVLEGASPYVASLLADTASKQIITSSGELYRAQLKICAEYVRNVIVPHSRNPVIAKVKDADVCFRDDMDPHRDIWNALAVYGDLGVQLTLRGEKAEGITTSETARADLEPLFALVNVGGK